MSRLSRRALPGIRAAATRARFGLVTAMADCCWADRATAARNLESFGPGRKFALASGLLKITYRLGIAVILQGPALYEADSVGSGELAFGKATVIVGRPTPGFLPAVLPVGVPPFSLRTPATVLNMHSRPGTYGIEVDRSGVSSAHLFSGTMTMEVTGPETGCVRVVPLCQGQVGRVEPSGAKRVVTCIDQAAVPDLFAQLTIKPAGASSNGGRWLRELKAEPGVPLIAVGGEPDWGGALNNAAPAATDWTISKAAGGGATRAGPQAPGAIDTCRVNFQITDLVPATVVLRGRFAAASRVIAMRLNGNTLQCPPHADDPATRQSGAFAIRYGFVAGENVWEINVDSPAPNCPLVVSTLLSGIHPPQREKSAEAVVCDPRRERRTEVR